MWTYRAVVLLLAGIAGAFSGYLTGVSATSIVGPVLGVIFGFVGSIGYASLRSKENEVRLQKGLKEAPLSEEQKDEVLRHLNLTDHPVLASLLWLCVAILFCVFFVLGTGLGQRSRLKDFRMSGPGETINRHLDAIGVNKEYDELNIANRRSLLMVYIQCRQLGVPKGQYEMVMRQAALEIKELDDAAGAVEPLQKAVEKLTPRAMLTREGGLGGGP